MASFVEDINIPLNILSTDNVYDMNTGLVNTTVLMMPKGQYLSEIVNVRRLATSHLSKGAGS